MKQGIEKTLFIKYTAGNNIKFNFKGWEARSTRVEKTEVLYIMLKGVTDDYHHYHFQAFDIHIYADIITAIIITAIRAGDIQPEPAELEGDALMIMKNPADERNERRT
ncbi:hypothetical protein SESBI_31234 [Sesbania bispinosa]|nr:hypothetical protein SESBI_31234 [Sesbania bispinosa]